MWVRLPNQTYVNLDNNARLAVSRSEDGYRVFHLPEHGHSNTLGTGYASEEDAQGALDEFASQLEFVQVQPPVKPEETAEATQEEED